MLIFFSVNQLTHASNTLDNHKLLCIFADLNLLILSLYMCD